MSKCVKCLDYYHPDWIVYQEVRGDMVTVCAFCRLDKNELTVTDDNGKVKEIVSKKQASKNYKRYLEQLSKKPGIANIINKQTQDNERNSIKRG
jgi:hypothetical protein